MTGEDDQGAAPREASPRFAVRGALLAFAWVFGCGVLWVVSGARHTPGGFDTSVALGFLAAAPGFLLALVLFVRQTTALLRGRAVSGRTFASLLVAGGALFGGVVMDLMVWSLFVDRLYPHFFAHGRRLHRGGEILAPRTAPGAAWIGDVETPCEVPSSAREGVAAQWRENAGKEHASIAAFAQLTLDLVALGAPPALVAASQADALDEVRHAEACYAFAARIDGRTLGPAPFPEARAHRSLPAARDAALASVALDALADGALNEGIASRLLGRLSKRAGTVELGALLARMAEDEARHAQHSWDVIAWCLDEGGPLVGRALARALREMPARLGSPLPEPARYGGWEAWGVQGVALEVAEYAVVRRQAQRRLAALLEDHARRAA